MMAAKKLDKAITGVKTNNTTRSKKHLILFAFLFCFFLALR